MSQYRNTSTITTLIIHCAATPNGRHFDVQDIDNWHFKRGFQRGPAFVTPKLPILRAVGYHFVICLDGEVQEGRLLDETGAHARGHNRRSIGLCLIGTDKFTEQQWLSLKQQVQALKNRFPDLKIIGHHEVNSHKTCPCFDVKAWLKADMRPLIEHLYNLNAHD